VNPRPVDSRSLRQLKRLPLVSAIDARRWRTLAPHIGTLTLWAGETLFHADTSSQTLFLVIKGELGLDMPWPGSAAGLRLQTRGPGQTAGDFALLNASRHLVTAVATVPTRVATLPGSALELLTDIEPAILAHVYDTAAELSRRVTLARLFLDLFGEVAPRTMQALLVATRVRQYRSGEVVFRTGEAPDGLHFVVSGRVVVERAEPIGERRRVAELRAPATVGELALLSDGVRSADVIAARESTLGLLPHEAFQSLVIPDARLLGSLTRLLVRRQLDAAGEPGQRSKVVPDRTFAILPLHGDVPLPRLLRRLKRELRRHGTTTVLDAAGFDVLYGKPDTAQTPSSDLFASAVTEWLDDKEARTETMLYIGSPSWDAWTQRIVNRADRILLVASATCEDASLREAERRLIAAFEDTRWTPRRDLLLLHAADTDRPSRTERWLAPRTIDDFHHVRLDDANHIARLARRLTGRARGLVFSGGGARGYAHLGVQRLIEERRVTIDCIGGSSMGALLGAAMAMGRDHASVMALSSRFASRRALFDYTLPIVSLMASAKLSRFCREVYGQTRIEDMWMPFFAVSSNLANGQPVVHDRGPLWQVVRSSISLPGLFSPVPTAGGDLLIDGAVLDGFPVHTMLERLGGQAELIGVNVSHVPERFVRFGFGSSLSGWRVLWSRLSPFSQRIDVPRLAETLLRATDIKDLERLGERRERIDVLIEPDVSNWSLLDFKHFALISEVGYREARRVFDAHPSLASHHSTGKRD